jgi:hypothetical protein
MFFKKIVFARKTHVTKVWIGVDEAEGEKEQRWVMGRALGKFWREGVELNSKIFQGLLARQIVLPNTHYYL